MTQRLRDLLSKLVGPNYCVNTQAPVTTADSEPEPDCAVLRGSRSNFRGRKPLAKEVSLVIEVADTSLHRDRTWKKQIYARAGIPLYWIVNLEESRVEVYSQPVKSRREYKLDRVFESGKSVPLVLDGNEIADIAVADILP